MKRCYNCNTLKETSEFYSDKYTKDGLKSCCRECTRNRSQKWRQENPEKVRQGTYRWREKNREYWRNYLKHIRGTLDSFEYKGQHTGRSRDEARSFIRDWKAQYDIKNREKNSQYHKEKAKVTGFRDRVNERERKRRSTNISHRIGVSFRSRVSSVLKQRQIDKTGATMALIGCSLEQFRMWLEINFEPGMSWDNYGHGMDKWNIDHWHPCAAFDLTDHEQLATCFHWSNQFPCWQRDNIRKSSRVIGPLSDERVRKIEAFKRELLSAA